MTDTLASALAELQKQLPEVRKGETAEVQTKAGGKYTYQYADLADVSAAVLPRLAGVGLSFSSKPTLDEGEFGLAYTLRHTSGEQDQGWYPLPDPTRHTPQEIGSAITYARRYTLCAITGVAPGGDDDDGQAASRHVAASPTPKRKPAKSAPLKLPDIREPLYADIKAAREAKGWSAADVQTDFALWSKTDDHPEGKKLMDASADELLAYRETLTVGDPA